MGSVGVVSTMNPGLRTFEEYIEESAAATHMSGDTRRTAMNPELRAVLDRLRERREAAASHLPLAEYENCEGCQAASALETLGFTNTAEGRALSELVEELSEALARVVVGVGDDDWDCCHHARLGLETHTDDGCAGIAANALASVTEKLGGVK